MSYLPDEEENLENRSNHPDGEENRRSREATDNDSAADRENVPASTDEVEFPESTPDGSEERTASSMQEPESELTPAPGSDDSSNPAAEDETDGAQNSDETTLRSESIRDEVEEVGDLRSDEEVVEPSQPNQQDEAPLVVEEEMPLQADSAEPDSLSIEEDGAVADKGDSTDELSRPEEPHSTPSKREAGAEPGSMIEASYEPTEEFDVRAFDGGEPTEPLHVEGEGQAPLSGHEPAARPDLPEESIPELPEETESEREKAELVDNTLDGIAEIVKSDEEAEGREAEVREEAVDELAHIIEAIIFASDEPLTANTIKSVLDASRTFGRLNLDMISDRVNALNNKYESDGSGFQIVEIANGYQFATRKEMAQWVSNLFKERSKRKLSTSALESLAIIAYKQPITKPEIESIRGVNVDYVLHNLLEKELVTVVGRADTVGRPLLYGTTQKFLKIFVLKSLDDLPKLREIDEIIKEIKSKGAEESIQLEITALGDQAQAEEKAESQQKAGD